MTEAGWSSQKVLLRFAEHLVMRILGHHQPFFTSFSELHFAAFSLLVTVSATEVPEGRHEFPANWQDCISYFLTVKEENFKP